MLRNKSLATRMGLGFTCIVFIACGLGAFAVYDMNSVKRAALEMVEKHVPTVTLANEIERWSFLTMYAARGYVLGGDENLRAVAEENLATVMTRLSDATRFAVAQGDEALQDSLALATERATEYQRHLRDTKTDINAMNEIKVKFLDAADTYQVACEAFLASQRHQLDREIASVTSVIKPNDTTPSRPLETTSIEINIDSLRGRSRKAELGEHMDNIGNAIRVATWESIAMNTPDRMAASQAHIPQMESILDELHALCQEESDLKRIEECRIAGKIFHESMINFLSHWRDRKVKDEQRQVSAQAVLDTAHDAALLSIDEIRESSRNTVERLSQGATTLVVGLGAGACFALLLTVLITAGVAKPLVEITRVARLAAIGETGHFPNCRTGGEIGILADAFKDMSIFFDDLSTKGQRIAEGDYTVEIVPRSEKDTLGKALSAMTSTLRAVAKAASEVADGNYTTEIVVRSEKDQLGFAIQQMVSRLRQSADEMRSREWTKTGVGDLAEKIRGEHSMASLASSVVTFLAQYVDAQLAAIYVLDESGEWLVRLADYAGDARNRQERIKVGEGLVGQAAVDMEAIHVHEVPDGYTRISSALGEGAPVSLLVMPFQSNNALVGVVEFAAFESFSETKTQFLLSVMEGIAIAFNTARYRQQMEELLEQVQCQAEELQAKTGDLEKQQCEMKATNEELEQQSEELRTSNEELEEKTEVLERQTVQLERNARELEQASCYKSEFLANMSHELRTPLNSLLILSRMLASNDEGNLTEEQVQSANIIQSGGQDLLALINEILDLSKAEAGMMVAQNEEVQIESLAARIIQLFNPSAEQKGLEFSVMIAPGLPGAIVSDGQRLEQILRNLLSNAFKFTEQGAVAVEICRPGIGTHFENVHLSPETAIAFVIRDTGPGIPSDKHQAIFEAFKQADGSRSRKYGGTGLGLSISRALSLLLGGEIHLESEAGVGSTFTLYMPCAPIANQPIPKSVDATSTPKSFSPSSAPRDRVPLAHGPYVPPIPDDRENLESGDFCVLVIEDDLKFAEILRQQVRLRGFKCVVASDGASGLGLANQLKPGAIILDLGLPDIAYFGREHFVIPACREQSGRFSASA